MMRQTDFTAARPANQNAAAVETGDLFAQPAKSSDLRTRGQFVEVRRVTEGFEIIGFVDGPKDKVT